MTGIEGSYRILAGDQCAGDAALLCRLHHMLPFDLANEGALRRAREVGLHGRMPKSRFTNPDLFAALSAIAQSTEIETKELVESAGEYRKQARFEFISSI